LFALRIRGGQSLNLFEAAPFGTVFWLSQLCLVGLCLIMPLLRILGAVTLALLVSALLVFLFVRVSAENVGIPLEFELLIVLVLTAVYAMLSYLGDQRDQKRIASLLSKFVPEELSDQYQRDPGALSIAGEERVVSVLFCDIRDFSLVAQALDSKQLAKWLNLYFSYVSKIVVRYRGSIDKYMGDSVMAVWGAPAESTTHAYDALSAALDIQKELDELNDDYKRLNLPAISMGIGISTGPAMVGPLGSEYRMDYTVIGDTVNVASRLEEQTRKYQVPVIVSDRSAEDLPDLLFRELDTVSVKGRDEPVTMYQPLCAVEDASEALLELVSIHEAAMLASVEGQWDQATELFLELRERWGPEGMYDRYLRGIEQARR
jgi:adenylate cyclase